MNFSEYQKKSRQTAVYPNAGKNFMYPTLGLSGEAGEVANKIKKIARDKGGVLDDDYRQSISRELGDTLWYVAQLATELGLDLDTIAKENIARLAGRKKRGTLHGSGDDR